jgi:hypothetical protein
MTTPQGQLYTISDRLFRLEQLLAPPDEYSIFDHIERIDEELKKIDAMQDQLNLIIKLLGKHE